MDNILVAIVIGAVVGLLARFFLPGRQDVGMIMTIVVGIVGAIVGNFIGEAISPDGSNAMHWILSVISAIGLLMLYGALTGKRRTT